MRDINRKFTGEKVYNIIKNLLLSLIIFASFLNNIYSQEEESKPENLGKSVNSECDEILPIISADGKTLYFCRGDCEGGYGKQDIWYSTLLADSTWSPALNIGPPLNNEFNNFVHAVTPDGNTLLLGNVYNDDGTIGRGVSISRKTTEGWSIPEKVFIDNYGNLDESESFYLANDGKTILMSVRRKDTYGEKDIYVSFYQDGGTFTEPLNLGSIINTDSTESTPFLASDGVTLYFSSNGHKGYGNADIFMSRRLDTTWQRWTTPKNLGSTVNTPEWDGYLKIAASGIWAYMVSTQNSFGYNDIFRIKLPEMMKPLPVLLIYGKVINLKTRLPVEAEITYQVIPSQKEAGIAHSDPVDGKYQVILPVGSNYLFIAKATGYFSYADTMPLIYMTQYTEFERDIELVPLEDSIMSFRNVQFKSGSAELTKESFIELDKVFRFLNGNPTVNLEVHAHTDNVGGDIMNQRLSERRSKSILDYLLKKGTKQERITSFGHGESVPIQTNDTPEGRASNRRVEFKIIKPVITN